MRKSHPLLVCLFVVATVFASARNATAYPTSVPHRPLTLPSNMLELGADLHFDFGGGSGFGDVVGVNLDLVSGASFGEFFFGADLHLEGGSMLHDVRGGLSKRISGNLALRWDSGIRNLTGRSRTDWRNSLQLRFKTRITSRVALAGGGGLLINWSHRRDVADLMQLLVLADFGPDISLTKNLSLAARVEVALGVSQSGSSRPGNGLGVDLRLLYAFSGAFDLFGALRIGDDHTGQRADHQLLFGLAGRL